MVKKFFILVCILLFVFSLNFASSASIDDEFKKLGNYAEDYEAGNLNYAQLLTHTSAIKQNMNGFLGATGKEAGGVLKQEQIKKILGESVEDTKWVWMEGEEREKKLDGAVPVWKKIIFDGRKIQIRLNAWPSIFSRREFKEKPENEEKNTEIEDLEGKLIYRLNFEIEFKKPEEQLNIQSRIDSIQALAKTFNSDPSSGNAEALAKESVNAERTFESYFRQSGGKCEDVMGSIFGTENKRQTQNLLVQEVSFCEGDNFEVIARLEMCDECEYNWINLDFWFEGRGPGFKPKEEESEATSSENFKSMNSADIEREIGKVIDGIKQSCANGDFNSIMSSKNKLWSLNDAWNQKSNDVWKEVDQTFKSQTGSMTQEQRQQFDQNYGWIKQEQEKRQKVKELGRSNYEARKQFYSGVFSGYEKKEYSFAQIEFQKRLLEEFKERGKEICDNNQDDNENEAIDCADDQCGGKICGKGTSSVPEGNETREVDVSFYCIEKQCKAREEMQTFVKNVSVVCQEIPPIECAKGGRVFFSRYDNETNCPVETSCLEETDSCEIDEDCRQPACGVSKCMENKCEVTELTECRESECAGGDERICGQNGNIVGICNNGYWEETGECEEEPKIRDEIIVGNECMTANDCGSDNVCNNGVCQVLPQVIVTEPEERITSEDEEETEEQGTIEESSSEPSRETESGITGNIIFNFIGALFSKMKITGAVITGFDAEETAASEPAPEESQPQDNNQQPPEHQPGQSPPQENQQPENQPQKMQNQQPMENRMEDDRNRERDDERRNEENRERCKKDCARPCIEKCIREGCGEKFDCVVEDVQKKCEGECEAKDDCVEKCMKGGDWWQEFENKDEHKEEKGVFQVGGNCRTSQGKTEGFIWFGGWGEPFEKIQPLKNKYYSGGQADWCKYDFENLKKQREEFEKSFNQEFVKWFFEKYLANSAESWEQSVSGIFELYWKDVDNSREMAYRMQCLGINELPNVNLINVKYESDYGKVEFWEEIKTVKLEGMDKEVQVISPYMKAWVFPPKEFIIYEMKKAMKNHEFPGSPEEKMERKNEEGPTAEEREMIKQDGKFMKQIKTITDKYGGNLDVAVRFVDNGNVVFNLYAQVNEKDIMKIKPMLPEEVPEEDVKIEIEFQKLYDIIYMKEREMRGERTESPPWDKKAQPVQKIKEVVKGVQMYFKARDMLNSAKVYPETSEKDARTLMKSFFSMMGSKKGGQEIEPEMKDEDTGEEKGVWDDKEKITGEVIAE